MVTGVLNFLTMAFFIVTSIPSGCFPTFCALFTPSVILPYQLKKKKIPILISSPVSPEIGWQAIKWVVRGLADSNYKVCGYSCGEATPRTLDFQTDVSLLICSGGEKVQTGEGRKARKWKGSRRDNGEEAGRRSDLEKNREDSDQSSVMVLSSTAGANSEETWDNLCTQRLNNEHIKKKKTYTASYRKCG